MKILKKTLSILFFAIVIFGSMQVVPVFAKGGLVPCDGVVEQPDPKGGTKLTGDCDFATIFGKASSVGGGQQGDDRGLIKKIFDMIILLVLPITAVWCIYVGFLYLTSGGNTETHSKAIKIGLNVLAGLVLIICAWLIVATIMRAFGVKDAFNLLKT